MDFYFANSHSNMRREMDESSRLVHQRCFQIREENDSLAVLNNAVIQIRIADSHVILPDNVHDRHAESIVTGYKKK